jgi:RES domain-containing protein
VSRFTAAAAIGLRTKTVPATGTWYRALQTRFIHTSLATSHTRTTPSRFGEGKGIGPEVLYLAPNHQVALLEVQALLGSPTMPGGLVPHPATSWTVLNMSVQLTHVLDLTDPAIQSAMQVTVQELTGDWRGYELRALPTSAVKTPTGPAPTQELGALLDRQNFEGFFTVSAKDPTERNLVVFPNQLKKGNAIRWFNPLTNTTESIAHRAVATDFDI